MTSPVPAADLVLGARRAPRVAGRPREDVDRRLAIAVVVDARLLAGRGGDEGRVQLIGTDRRTRDRDRALHAGVLTHGRVPVGGGDARGHRPMIGRYHPAMSVPAPEIPRFRLFDAPSPVAPLPRLSAALGGRTEIWVKREDLLPLAFGGNKLRNLEFLVGAALAEGADTLVTSGRRWSNHCRLTAAAGAAAGLAVELVLSGPPASVPGPGVRLMTGVRGDGAPIAQRGPGRTGGGGGTGHRGGRRAGRTAVCHRCGGLGGARRVRPVARGSRAVRPGRRARPHGGPHRRAVGHGRDAGRLDRRGREPLPGDARRGRDRRPPRVRAATGDRIDGPWPGAWTAPARVDPDQAIELDERQLGDGYGRPTAEAGAAADLLARTEGILVDPIYTAKALASLVASVRAAPSTGSGSCSGTPAACPGSSSRSIDVGAPGRRLDRHSPADRHASRIFIRPAVWSTAPA